MSPPEHIAIKRPMALKAFLLICFSTGSRFGFFRGLDMAKKDPTKESAFQRVIGVFLSTPHKLHEDMKPKNKSKKRRKPKK